MLQLKHIKILLINLTANNIEQIIRFCTHNRKNDSYNNVIKLFEDTDELPDLNVEQITGSFMLKANG